MPGAPHDAERSAAPRPSAPAKAYLSSKRDDLSFIPRIYASVFDDAAEDDAFTLSWWRSRKSDGD